MAATSHPSATLTAIPVLQGGGNDVDAAVGLDLQSAIALPRVVPIPGTNQVEGPVAADARMELTRRGFELVAAVRAIGGAQAVWIDWENGSLIGGSDHRKDGCGLGW